MYDLLTSKKATYNGKNLKVTITFKGQMFAQNKQVYDINGENVIYLKIDNKVESVQLDRLCLLKDFLVYNN